MSSYNWGKSYTDVLDVDSKETSVEIYIDDVLDGIEDFNIKTKRALREYLEQEACPMLTQYMQANREWRDRTNTARLGLKAEVEKTGNMKRTDWRIRVALTHSAYHNGYPYGASLEYGSENVLTGGRNKPYPILEPTVRKKGGDVVNGMKAVVERYYF